MDRPARPHDAPNPNARLLVLYTDTEASREGSFQLVGALASSPAANAPALPFRPLAVWSAPDAALAAD